MRPVRINAGEAFFECFYDPDLSELSAWSVHDEGEAGLKVRQNWCWVEFDWHRPPHQGAPALCMDREYEPAIECDGYDDLLLSANLTHGSELHIALDTDAGSRERTRLFSEDGIREVHLPLDGATEIRSVRLQVREENIQSRYGLLNWIGLQNAALTEAHQKQFTQFHAGFDFSRYLTPEDTPLTFTPRYGIVIDAKDLEEVRRTHAAYLAAGATSSIVEKGETAMGFDPAALIDEFVNFWDNRYTRERMFDTHLLDFGVDLAECAILTKNAPMMRKAAMTALALCFCRNWDMGPATSFPGSTFDVRPFNFALCCHDIAIILDLCGECFSEFGTRFILRRLGEAGLGPINFAYWKYEYIYHCNQAAWFSYGRVIAYCVLMQHYPRVKPYLELAYAELNESIELSVSEDGGYPEGPGYSGCVARFACLAYYFYARSTGREMTDVLPPRILRMAGFAELIRSTLESADCVPVCDGGDFMNMAWSAVFAHLMPQSAFVEFYHRGKREAGGMPDTLRGLQLDATIPEEAPSAAPVSYMHDLGWFSSVREANGHHVKLFTMGNSPGAGHNHEDKGSFILEYAGEAFAMDSGMVSYEDPMCEILGNCQRHNMLLPFGSEFHGRPRPVNPVPAEIKPDFTADAEAVRLTLDLTPSWPGTYAKWIRTIDSPRPELYTITDEYALEKGEGVQFIWLTPLGVSVDGRNVTIRGRRGEARLAPSEGCRVRVEEMEFRRGHPPIASPQKRITFERSGRNGVLEVRVVLV